MLSLIEGLAEWLGQGVCDVAAAVMLGQFRCHDPAVLSMVGYIVLIVALMVSLWAVVVRPRAE
jgi:hypothetical protein